MKKNRFLSLAFAVLFFLTPFCMSVSAAAVFPDVPDDHWAKDYIQECVNLKIIDGCPDGTYKPENPVLACEFIKMVVCAFSEGWRKGAESTKLPESSHWARGYLGMGDGMFFIARNYKSDEALNETITRLTAAEMAFSLFMWRNSDDDSKNHFDRTGTYIKDITDISTLTETQKNVVNSVISFDLMSAFDDGTFRPDDTLTRAEAAEIIYYAVTK